MRRRRRISRAKEKIIEFLGTTNRLWEDVLLIINYLQLGKRRNLG